ncbi:hypothetical protein V5799_027696 [Amblyomma americanum]|uniref:Uncharacterized protein n=1 Tax=Amblyomma americanum TaxID=6943 RepID=A0AAQ4DEZ8_AMBAM
MQFLGNENFRVRRLDEKIPSPSASTSCCRFAVYDDFKDSTGHRSITAEPQPGLLFKATSDGRPVYRKRSHKWTWPGLVSRQPEMATSRCLATGESPERVSDSILVTFADHVTATDIIGSRDASASDSTAVTPSPIGTETAESTSEGSLDRVSAAILVTTADSETVTDVIVSGNVSGANRVTDAATITGVDLLNFTEVIPAGPAPNGTKTPENTTESSMEMVSAVILVTIAENKTFTAIIDSKNATEKVSTDTYIALVTAADLVNFTEVISAKSESNATQVATSATQIQLKMADWSPFHAAPNLDKFDELRGNDSRWHIGAGNEESNLSSLYTAWKVCNQNVGHPSWLTTLAYHTDYSNWGHGLARRDPSSEHVYRYVGFHVAVFLSPFLDAKEALWELALFAAAAQKTRRRLQPPTLGRVFDEEAAVGAVVSPPPPKWRVCLRLIDRLLPSLLIVAYAKAINHTALFQELMSCLTASPEAARPGIISATADAFVYFQVQSHLLGTTRPLDVFLKLGAFVGARWKEPKEYVVPETRMASSLFDSDCLHKPQHDVVLIPMGMFNHSVPTSARERMFHIPGIGHRLAGCLFRAVFPENFYNPYSIYWTNVATHALKTKADCFAQQYHPINYPSPYAFTRIGENAALRIAFEDTDILTVREELADKNHKVFLALNRFSYICRLQGERSFDEYGGVCNCVQLCIWEAHESSSEM